jgi:hypothetical protein
LHLFRKLLDAWTQSIQVQRDFKPRPPSSLRHIHNCKFLLIDIEDKSTYAYPLIPVT